MSSSRSFDINFKIQYSASHTNKQIYLYMSQYPTTRNISAKVKHLVKWRNIKHMDPAHSNKSLNAKTQVMNSNVKLSNIRVIILV